MCTQLEPYKRNTKKFNEMTTVTKSFIRQGYRHDSLYMTFIHVIVYTSVWFSVFNAVDKEDMTILTKCINTKLFDKALE